MVEDDEDDEVDSDNGSELVRETFVNDPVFGGGNVEVEVELVTEAAVFVAGDRWLVDDSCWW